jgi:hypothetical protein
MPAVAMAVGRFANRLETDATLAAIFLVKTWPDFERRQRRCFG